MTVGTTFDQEKMMLSEKMTLKLKEVAMKSGEELRQGEEQVNRSLGAWIIIEEPYI